MQPYISTTSSWLMYTHRLVANPFKVTLRQLLDEYENVTYPITLVCAGNRRKEQNVVRKSKGFSWGPSGVSTALFTGVVMKDIIERAKPLKRGKYVCMEGADKLVSLPSHAMRRIADIVHSPMVITALQ
jgi:nitrate reductase (NAD(P)H)